MSSSNTALMEDAVVLEADGNTDVETAAMLPTADAAGRPAAGLTRKLQAPFNLDAQDGIRGLASIVVVVGHLLTYWAPNNGGPYPQLGLEYLSAVTLFFVISGFTLVAVYDKGDPSDDTAVALATGEKRSQFLWKRVARLAPMYYLGLLLAIPQLIVYKDTFQIATSVPLSLLWLQSLTSIIGNDWNGPLWTCSAFTVSYYFFPFFLRKLRAKTVIGLWVEMAGYSAVSTVLVLVWIFWLQLSNAFFLHAFAPFRLLHFAVGVCAGLIAKRAPFTRPTLVAELCTAVLVLNQAVCMRMTALADTVGLGSAYWTVHMYGADYIAAPVQALWIMALAHPQCGGLTKRVLSSRPMRYLGETSYALYCTHWPVINLIAWAAAGRGITFEGVPLQNFPGLQAWFFYPTWAIPLVTAGCVAVSILAYHAVEKPGRAWLLARLQRSK